MILYENPTDMLAAWQGRYGYAGLGHDMVVLYIAYRN